MIFYDSYVALNETDVSDAFFQSVTKKHKQKNKDKIKKPFLAEDISSSREVRSVTDF